MDEEELYIASATDSLETISTYSDPMISAIMLVALQGHSLEWFLENWIMLVIKYSGSITPEQTAAIGPWIKTWAEEAYKRVEKEKI